MTSKNLHRLSRWVQGTVKNYFIIHLFNPEDRVFKAPTECLWYWCSLINFCPGLITGNVVSDIVIAKLRIIGFPSSVSPSRLPHPRTWLFILLSPFVLACHSAQNLAFFFFTPPPPFILADPRIPIPSINFDQLDNYRPIKLINSIQWKKKNNWRK